MIKKITYELNYRIKGEKKIKKIDIDFIPNQRHEDWGKLQAEIYEVSAKWNHIKALQEEVLLLLKEKDKNNIEAIKEFKTEIEKLTNDLNYLRDSKIIERRFNLIKDILIDNGYSGDSELMSFEFWNNCVEPTSINEFLQEAISKDIDKKKVVH